MQVFVHFTILKSVEGGFLEGRVRRAQVGEQGCEALADFERVGHDGAGLVVKRAVSEKPNKMESRSDKLLLLLRLVD